MKTIYEITDYIIESAITRIEWNAMSETAHDMYVIALDHIYGGAY